MILLENLTENYCKKWLHNILSVNLSDCLFVKNVEHPLSLKKNVIVVIAWKVKSTILSAFKKVRLDDCSAIITALVL